MVARLGRAFTGLAILALVTTVALGFVPNPGTAVEYTLTDERVNCGTPFVDTGYDLDEGCEGTYLARMGWMVLAWLVALVTGGIGLVLLRWGIRRN